MNKDLPHKDFKYIFGPVSSWRLGVSLGIDLLSQKEKVCSMNCVYCQLGTTVHLSDQRKVYVPTSKIMQEIRALPAAKFDYITFSSRGEPTLAKNLGELIREIKAVRDEKIAVITNSSLLDDRGVRQDLMGADCVIAKLDACGEDDLCQINQVMRGLQFQRIVSGIKKFREGYKGKIALQIMFIDANKDKGKELAAIARTLNPDEVELNTPLRPSAVKPLPPEALTKIKKHFKGLTVRTVYESEKKPVFAIDQKKTAWRHGECESKG